MPEIRSLFAAVVAVLWGLAPAAAWHQEMADSLRSIDPWQHLITTSFADSTRCLTP